MENIDDEKTRIREVLRVMRGSSFAEEVSREIGGFVGLREAALLLADLCEYAERFNQARLFVACAEALKIEVRGVRALEQIASAPHRPDDTEQRAGKHPDTLQALSRLLAYYGKEAWENGSWENAAPRVIDGLAPRLDRTKRLAAIGNGQIPAVAALAWRLLRGE